MKKITAPPLSVTSAAIFVLFMTLWNGLRTYSALLNWQILQKYQGNPIYILLSGMFWALAGLWLFINLWSARPRAWYWGLGTAGLYYSWYWFDRLVVQASPAPNTVFNAFASTILLGIFGICISLPVSKAFFNKE